MALISLAPFINYHLCDDTPSLQEMIAHELLKLGLKYHKIDAQSIVGLQSADIIHTRVPVILRATGRKENKKNADYLLEILKSKFHTAMIIEGIAENIPALIAEQKNALAIWPRGIGDETVRKFTRLVYENMHKPILNLDFIAMKLHLSAQSLQEKFHSVGLPGGLWHYIIELRMREAERLIKESPLPLQEISQILCHREYSTFSKAFKRVVGISPSLVKRMVKQRN